MSQPVTAHIEAPILTPEQEQEKWLGEAIRNVKEKSMYMREAIKRNEFVHTLRYASQMLAELRTGMLTPPHYYELYVKVFDEMQGLEAFVLDQMNAGRSVDDMYEVVQHAGNIVPRLYLLITVGTIYIKSKRAPAKDILRDMVEMCKGVQHPTRGLFLRSYLLSTAKNCLPDVGNEYDGEGGSVEDSAQFILQNFKEMVWLWVRMEGKANQSKTRKEKERKELRILVGFNLVRLSQLDGIDKHAYQSVILPRVLSIIMAYKEPLAQQYLLEVIIQVFPDEFHLLTLNELLASLADVVQGVNVHSILTSLMDRLGNYVVALREGTAESSSKKEDKIIRNMFSVFSQQISSMGAKGAVFTTAGFAETQFSLIKLVLKTYPGAYDRVDEVLGALRDHYASIAPDADATKVTKRLLTYLMSEVRDLNVLLDLTAFDGVLEHLNFKTRREVAMEICAVAVNAPFRVSTLERVAKLFDIIAPMVKDLDDTPADKSQIYTMDPVEEFIEEQSMVSRILHIIDSEDLGVLFKMYSGARKQLGQGGMQRMRRTLKAMVFLYMRLAIRAKKVELSGSEPGVAVAKPFQYIHSGDGKGILELLTQEIPDETIFMYVACANAADTCELPDVAYELYCEAITIYENNVADSKDQIHVLSTMISSLHSLKAMPEESYEVIATKICQHSSKMLKKNDQCKMVALCANLFWKKTLSEEYHKKVLECLQRALKIADHSQPIFQLPLFVELLNQFLHFYAAAAPGVTVRFVTALLELIRTAQASDEVERNATHDEATLYHKNTVKYIKSRQQDDERWQEIEL